MILTGCLVLLFLILHEAGHIVGAMLLRLKITKIGISKAPLPHFYVAVRWPYDATNRTLYLLSGFMTFCVAASVVLLFFDSKPAIVDAIIIQLAIETNPFYSDFIILLLSGSAQKEMRSPKFNYRAEFQKAHSNFLYSPKWYAYFIVWSLTLFYLIKLTRI
jgi:hypothetical protein